MLVHDKEIERRFVDTPAGQFHVRCSRESATDGDVPLVLLHASPSSSLSVTSLVKGIGKHRPCYAPDTMGFGDTAPPPTDAPEIKDYAEWLLHAVDALGIDRFHIYGSHTGAHIAVEAAISQPDRIGHVVLDGVAMFTEDEKCDVLANYAPTVVPDDIGSQLNWAWHFLRDQAIYFPYYHRDAEHRRNGPMMTADILHHLTVDVLKALRTYHLGYHAAFQHPVRERLPMVTQPTLVMSDRSDPLRAGVDAAARLVRDSTTWFSPDMALKNALGDKIAGIETFLGGGSPA